MEVTNHTSEQSSADAAFAQAMQRSEQITARLQTHPAEFSVLTGDRPTGPLHIAHYFGSLLNRVELQNKGVPTSVIIADYQALTDRTSDTTVTDNSLELVADYLAVGIDPEQSMIFAHSQVPCLNQLLLPFLSVISVAELGHNPTVKDEMKQSGSASSLMFTYPAHQAADILFCRANLVPGGRDQLPHIEITRTIARRLNKLYFDEPFFPEPDILFGDVVLMPGLDGKKMSKSRGNAIDIKATADETAVLLKKAPTDSDRHITYDPANRPAVANLLELAALCSGEDPAMIAQAIGDGGGGGLKQVVTTAVNDRFAEIRQRRTELAANPDYLKQVIRDGSAQAADIAADTLGQLHAAMGLQYN